jgi:preprotein translocase subunit SecD
MDQQPPYQHQSPAPYDPAKRNRGPVVLVLALVAVLAAVITVGAFLLLRDDDQAPAPDAKRSTPASPEAVQLRRVVTATPCTDKAADCADGFRYKLGQVELDGGHIESVTAGPGQGTTWQIMITLDDDGAKRFGKLTTELAAKGPPANQLAIQVRGRVVSAPAVQGAITDGRVQISGNFTKESAERLVAEITG